MTTRLAGNATHFLPFNKGLRRRRRQPARSGRSQLPHRLPVGRGAGRATACSTSWRRFIHLQIEEKRDDQGRKVKVETMIFPRYHQLDAVRQLVGAARARRRGAQLSGRALGGQRQEQHHRLAGPPAGVAP